MMKNMKKMTALACAAMMITAFGITGCQKADGQTKNETSAVVIETPAENETSQTTENEAVMPSENTGNPEEAADASAPFSGTIVSVTDGELTMHRNDNGFDEEVVVTIADDTKILDAENGYPVEPGDLKEGTVIRAYVGPAMTMSLPPIANGIMILTGTEESNFPEYTQVKDLTPADKDGEYLLTGENGKEYTVTAETRLFPYLTRNIVSEEDLTKGTDILVWNAEDGSSAEKIVIFQGESGYGN